MIVLVVDTETSGLPKEKNASIYQSHLWPHIVQLAFIVYDTDKNSLLFTYDQIIKLDKSVKLEPGAVAVHGIDAAIIAKKGIPIVQGLIALNEWSAKSDLIVGHNISFDKRMLYVEYIRNKIHGFGNKIKPTFFCTMKQGATVCNIINKAPNGDMYIKYPKLSELYEKCFQQKPDKLHNAFCDVLICLRCYCALVNHADPYESCHGIKDLFDSFII